MMQPGCHAKCDPGQIRSILSSAPYQPLDLSTMTKLPRQILASLLAGLGATLVHLLLMEVKHRAGMLPSFEPYEYLHQALSPIVGQAASLGWAGWIPDVNGGMILGFAFGRAFAYLPGRSHLLKGAVFGVMAWLTLGLVLFPLAGHGAFAHEIGLGWMPAMLMLVMLMVYSAIMSSLYVVLAGLTRVPAT